MCIYIYKHVLSFCCMQASFPSLEKLVIEGLDKMTTIWHTQLAADSFCKLTAIYVTNCTSLIHIIGPGILERLYNLKELYVSSCELLKAVIKVELRTSGGDRSKLLKCKSVKNVFPAAVTRVIEKLEELSISDCEKLEQIIADNKEEVGQGTTIITMLPEFVYRNVMILKLMDLPQLISFHPGMHTSMWPALKILWIIRCDKIECLAEKCSSFPQRQEEHEHDPIELPFFIFQRVRLYLILFAGFLLLTPFPVHFCLIGLLLNSLLVNFYMHV